MGMLREGSGASRCRGPGKDSPVLLPMEQCLTELPREPRECLRGHIAAGTVTGLGGLPSAEHCQIAYSAEPGIVEEQKHRRLADGVELERPLPCGEESMARNSL